MRLLLLIASVFLIPAAAAAAPDGDFHKLLDDHWAWAMRQDPVQATALGIRSHDDQVADISLEAEDRRAADRAAFLKRLEAIPEDGLSPADRINRRILKRMLEEANEANRFGQRMILFTNREGTHQSFAGLADAVPLRSRADYESYLARLARYPAVNDMMIRITERAVKQGYVQPCEAMTGFEKSISGVIAEDPGKSRFYQPFAGARPRDIAAADWAAMQARARALIRDVLNPAYTKFDRFYREVYRPRCASSPSVTAQPDGAAYYAFRVRQMTTTDLAPDAIHRIGLAEVARIRAEMVEVARRAGAPSREAFIAKLRTDPAYYPKSPEELMRAAARMAKTIDGKLPAHFGRLPRLPMA